MPGNEKETPEASGAKLKGPSRPMIFISHDARDADLAEAFSRLVRAVSSNMLRAFRSSDKKGTEGIAYGEEWYKRLMSALDEASDVVCLLTERSIDRPWILYEAGVARGKLGARVLGVAIGIPLGKVNTGPFYEFQNCDDSEDKLAGLMEQLAQRVPGMKPESHVVKSLVQKFKADTEKILSELAGPAEEMEEEEPSPAAVAGLFEELKAMYRDLPSRLEERLSEGPAVLRRRKPRRFHPMIFEEMSHMCGPRGQEVALLVFASLVRDDAPWLYEVAIQAYRALSHGTQKALDAAMRSVAQLQEFRPPRPILRELGMFAAEETDFLMMEGPHVLRHLFTRCIEGRRSATESK